MRKRIKVRTACIVCKKIENPDMLTLIIYYIQHLIFTRMYRTIISVKRVVRHDVPKLLFSTASANSVREHEEKLLNYVCGGKLPPGDKSRVDLFLLQFDPPVREKYRNQIIFPPKIVSYPCYFKGITIGLSSLYIVPSLLTTPGLGLLSYPVYGVGALIAICGVCVFKLGGFLDKHLQILLSSYTDMTYLLPTDRKFMSLRDIYSINNTA